MADTLSVRFHASLYPADAVSRAAERFAPLVAGWTVESPDVDTLVTFHGVPERLQDRLGDELANHALYEAIRARRGDAT